MVYSLSYFNVEIEAVSEIITDIKKYKTVIVNHADTFVNVFEYIHI